ncbi:hypothetical protein RGQ29_018728 [Quercus rubra]|uniref:Wall-associated receptor kinase galacturonan-binding domain-containing protein n=1 Tax=Quercus rubra TaxID=3512 RepID=A0AAN7FS54_QUERU|nr:hypothetical protein RGQ29_018728 [Quercus rubra]
MVRGLPFTARLIALIVLVLVHKACSTENTHQCAPSSYGIIQNISYPFRLKGDPETCGDPRYELVCENNQAAFDYLGRKYYVQEINYNNYTIRVVDKGIQKENYSSTPSYSLNLFDNRFVTTNYNERRIRTQRSVVFMSCEKLVNTPFYLDTSTCTDNGEYSSNSSSISHSKRYKYVSVRTISVKDVKDSCTVEKIILTSWPGNDNPNISCTEVHNELVYGFELSWICGINCGRDRHCYLFDLNHVQCVSKIGG